MFLHRNFLGPNDIDAIVEEREEDALGDGLQLVPGYEQGELLDDTCSLCQLWNQTFVFLGTIQMVFPGRSQFQ